MSWEERLPWAIPCLCVDQSPSERDGLLAEERLRRMPLGGALYNVGCSLYLTPQALIMVLSASHLTSLCLVQPHWPLSCSSSLWAHVSRQVFDLPVPWPGILFPPDPVPAECHSLTEGPGPPSSPCPQKLFLKMVFPTALTLSLYCLLSASFTRMWAPCWGRDCSMSFLP